MVACEKKKKYSAQQREGLWKQSTPTQKKRVVAKVFKKLKHGKKK